MNLLLGFPVSGKMTALILSGWIATSPVVLFVFTQYYPVLCTFVLVGDGVVSCLGGGIVTIWLVIRLFPFRRLALVLYLCTSGTLHVLSSYGCGISGLSSVSYGMMWGSIWGG